jgi:AcrR family transcriptional regulator
MVTSVREDLLAAGLAVFERDGFDGATVAAIRKRARASNGSFFHVFASKKELAGALFLETLSRYHAAILTQVVPGLSAREGIDRLIRAHLGWVVEQRREARYLFEISRGDWTEELREAQRAQNARFAAGIERWRVPLLASGELLSLPTAIFASQVIGPAQIFCRAYLSGRERGDPRLHADQLVACAIRALVEDNARGEGHDLSNDRST